MREIKFRGWHKGLNKWVYGFLTRNKNGVYFIENEDSHFGIADVSSICQYTGLKDKDDCEIYEGDIVRVHEGEDFIWEEQVIENSGGYWVDENYLGAIHSFCEVIGNIYEHNHLLEESQNGTK